MLAFALGALLALAASDKTAIPWRVDAPRALEEAEAQGRPLLIVFRTACGRAADAGAVDDLGRSVHGSELSDCDLMQQDVWEHADVVGAVGRFVPVLTGEGGESTLNVRYSVARFTTVFADPWGNEIVRLVGYIPRDRFLRVLGAIPADFKPLRQASLALRQDREHFAALLAMASFYESGGKREFADRFYERALASTDTRADAAARRSTVVSRGMNLMQIGKNAEAAELFERTLRQAPDGPLAEALLLGQVMAEAQRGRKKEARKALEELRRRFPGSPYTAKAEEQAR